MVSFHSETPALWNPSEGSLKPRALDPWDRTGHRRLQAQEEGAKEPLSSWHRANVRAEVGPALKPKPSHHHSIVTFSVSVQTCLIFPVLLLDA